MSEERYEEFLAEMDKCIEMSSSDLEEAHYDADEILCKALLECGYTELVEKFDSFSKWYA